MSVSAGNKGKDVQWKTWGFLHSECCTPYPGVQHLHFSVQCDLHSWFSQKGKMRENNGRSSQFSNFIICLCIAPFSLSNWVLSDINHSLEKDQFVFDITDILGTSLTHQEGPAFVHSAVCRPFLSFTHHKSRLRTHQIITEIMNMM
jgi:hypothetical protein